MEDAQSASSLPPFLVKTYEMVDDPLTAQIVSWSQNNKSFIVWDPPEFAKELLPKYFKHNNFSSFIRQLNTYGFRKVDPEQWEFANDDFVRGQPHLLKNIHRRKPVHSHSLQNVQGQEFSSSSLNDSEKQGYKAEIERLKCDKESVFAELQIHKQEQEGVNIQILVLTNRFVRAEQRQKKMLHNIERNMQECGLSFDFLESSFAYERKRRLPRYSSIDDVAVDMDQRETNQVVARESSSVLPLSTLDMEMIEKLESSLMFWENIMQDIDDMDESTNHGDSPAMSLMQINVDFGNKNSGIDVNSEPPNPVVRPVAALEEPQVLRANDGFWEQFLTENPGSRDGQEVESERKDHEEKKSENGKSKSWWNVTSVNYLTEQLGHLSPAERT